MEVAATTHCAAGGAEETLYLQVVTGESGRSPRDATALTVVSPGVLMRSMMRGPTATPQSCRKMAVGLVRGSEPSVVT